MFPLSLKKNIRELDRQISLLETECEHLESEKKEGILPVKTNSKVVEMTNKPFVTGPCASISSYSSRMIAVSPNVPKVYSVSCAHFRPISDKFPQVEISENVVNRHCCKNSKFLKKTDKCTELSDVKREFSPVKRNGIVAQNSEERKEPHNSQNLNTLKIKEIKKSFKRPISSIIEVSESSDEKTFIRDSTFLKPKKNLIETSEKQTNDLLKEPITTEEFQKKNKKTPPGIEINKPKTSSDEGRNKYSDDEESKSFSDRWSNECERPLSTRKKLLNKRRLRSARTKKNHTNEIVLDVNMTKVLQEKEIQCMLGCEEKEKTEVFTNLYESFKTLCFLTKETQTKSSREKINEVLNDMKNSLKRISKINIITEEQNPLNVAASVKESTTKPSEGEELNHLKRTLYGVTKFCQELAGEKSALTHELLSKTRALSNFKNKEKEYLSVISSLKFGLRKMKQEAEGKAFFERDLEILKTKLQEETKVIEALRKSHEKMQELVENYVLENDKLKAKVKISKLETEKFHVLLAGKEEEINKYKKDIESFQRQITEQLSLLRSKATENEVVDALKAISDRTNSLHTEIDSNLSETTVEKENFKTLILKSIESTSLSSVESKTKKSVTQEYFKKEESPKKSISETPREEKNPKETCPTCKAIDSDSDTNSGTRRGLQRVLSSSKNLRSSINELLEDIRRETSEKHWSNAPCETTSLSISNTTSDDPSEKSDRSKK